MGLITGVWLALLGVLGASNLIIARKPDTKELIGKLAPYQGWIGAVSALWGAWWVIRAILNLDLIAHMPIFWIIWAGTGAVMMLLGFLLGIGVLKTFVKDEKAHAKADEMMTKLAPYQGTLGLVAIGLGVWGVLWSIVH